MELDCVAPMGDITGEGAVWSAAEACVYWTDINRFLVHRMSVGDRSVRTWFFDEPAVAVALTDQPGVLLVALATRILLWTPADDERQVDRSAALGAGAVRFNDARPCPRGTLLIGTMGNNVGPDGRIRRGRAGPRRALPLRRRTASRRSRPASASPTRSPGAPTPRPSTSPTRSPTRSAPTTTDPETGALGAAAPFFTGFERGAPDGSAIDSEGYLWNCRYGGGCVVRLAPDGSHRARRRGALRQRHHLHLRRPPTSHALHHHRPRRHRAARERLAGSVFALEAPAPGLPERPFRLG